MWDKGALNEVSIPYRYSNNRVKFNDDEYLTKFQFLIGTLITEGNWGEVSVINAFQFLIGTLITYLTSKIKQCRVLFQFLIGTLITSQCFFILFIIFFSFNSL